MSRRKLVLIEAILLAAALAAIAALFIFPFGSRSASAPRINMAVGQSLDEPMGPLLAEPVTPTPASVVPGQATPAPAREIPYQGTPAPPEAAESQPTPAALPGGCGFFVFQDPLTEAQILSYYGNPYSADMGILGELPPDELVERLKSHAQKYDSLNGPRGIQPALHMVYATAQGRPGPDGLYLSYVDDKTVRGYIDLARENGMLVFLDLQIGRSDVESEIRKILPYLEQPHVHVALDPEFAMPPGEVPGQTIGSLDAADINAAQLLLEGFVEERGLPDKILIVHQFLHNMITQSELIENYPRVRLVIDMDGFGPSHVKRVKYGWFTAPAEYSGIKLFFRHDPDLMSEEEVLELEPEPDVIIYQ